MYIMKSDKTLDVPRYTKLLQPVFSAIKELGGSARNDEILDRVIMDLQITDEVADISHNGNINQTELSYQLAWARTYLARYGVIENSFRSVWSVNPEFSSASAIDEKAVLSAMQNLRKDRKSKSSTKELPPEDDNSSNDDTEYPDEAKPWREHLSEILQNMNPYGFERLIQRLLRECGFTHVEVTKKSGDGGIDGFGRIRLNGFFSFSVAFQCKRYSGLVGSPAVRDFRGSLTTDIEKGVLITTGTFSAAAKEEAAKHGKQQIDLIDGEELISKIAECKLGVRPVITYEIDEDFFSKI